MQWLTIGQMAKLNNISEQTLRLYDKKGLISPVKRGGENGYRYYDIKQSAVLDMIQHMKSLGMNLRDIRAQLEEKDPGALEDILGQKHHQIEEELHRLTVQRRAIERMMESYEKYRAAPPDGTIILEYLEKRQMYYIETDTNFYNHGIDIYEGILRELRFRLAKDELPQIYFCNAGTIMRKEYVLKKQFYSTEVFVFVDPEFVDSSLTTSIPAGNYLCIYCDNFHKEKEYAERLLHHIEEKGYQISGDYLCETVAELPVIGNGERGMYLRLQIPVTFH